MRKHDVRKWLHAILDLLPVILIPVFMIYSHRHTIDSGSIDVPKNQVVDFNQLFNGSISDTINGVERTRVEDYYLTFDGTSERYNSSVPIGNIYSLITDNVYYFKYEYDSIPNGANFFFWDGSSNIQLPTTTQLYTSTFDNNVTISFWLTASDITFEDFSIKLNVFNLTKMFGSGNEPTINEFNALFPNFYSYTLSHKELLKGISTITYDDTDIMSQVVYQLYNSVDKYFNMGNVFNMTGVYDWFNLNIFNGNAPISIYIVWNIVLYEFVMDLLFLLYGLFMWFIDMVEKLMEKPLKSVK